MELMKHTSQLTPEKLKKYRNKFENLNLQQVENIKKMNLYWISGEFVFIYTVL